MDIFYNNINVDTKVTECKEYVLCQMDDIDKIINKDITILNKSRRYKIIIFKNLNITKNLNIAVNYAKIKFINVKAKNINIISSKHSIIEIHQNNCINNMSIWNNCYAKIKTFNESSCIKNINIRKFINKISNPCISFLGNFKSCNLNIFTSTKLCCENFNCYNPIKINIQDSKRKEIIFLGNFSNNKAKILNCECIIGSNINPPKDLLINIPSNTICKKIYLKGNLQFNNIKIEKNIILKVCCSCLRKLIIDENSKVKIIFLKNSRIIFLGIKGKVILYGNYKGVINALKHSVLLKSTGKLRLNYKDPLFNYIKPLIKCINKTLSYFIEEKNKNINLYEIEDICNSDNLNVNLEFKNLIKLEPESKIFYLKKNKIIYTPENADSSKIDLNKGILFIKFSYKQLYLCKPIIIKGKYRHLKTSFENNYSIIENYYNVVDYAFTQNYISNIILKENINIPNIKLNIINKNLNINLNKNSFLLNNIKIIDSNVALKNGELIPTNNLNLWNNVKVNNTFSKSFIKVDNKKSYSKLYCKNIKIQNPSIDFSSLSNYSTNTILFYIGNKTNKCNGIKFYLTNSSLEIKKQSINNKNNGNPYVIYSFANINIICNTNFKQSNNCIRINGATNCFFTKVILSENNFTKVTQENNNVLTLVPYSKSKGIWINKKIVKPNLSKTKMEKILRKIGEALITDFNNIKANAFGDGSQITLWSNEKKDIVENLIYNDDWWGVLDPPILLPDKENNDMQHVICITFDPNSRWINNISKIKIINSKERFLESNEFKIDKVLNKLYIYNIILNKLDVPIYQGLLEPGNNKIIIYSKNYKNAEVLQIIKAIQIVEFKNGVGKAITRINKEGTNYIKGNLISNEDKKNIGEPIDINIFK